MVVVEHGEKIRRAGAGKGVSGGTCHHQIWENHIFFFLPRGGQKGAAWSGTSRSRGGRGAEQGKGAPRTFCK